MLLLAMLNKVKVWRKVATPAEQIQLVEKGENAMAAACMATTAATGKQAQAVHSHHACRCKQAVLHGQRRLPISTLLPQCAEAQICNT